MWPAVIRPLVERLATEKVELAAADRNADAQIPRGLPVEAEHAAGAAH